MDVKPIQQGNLVAIEAEAGDSASAVRLADAFAQATVDVRNDRFQRGVERAVRLLEDRLSVSTSASEEQVLQEQKVLLRSFGGKDPTLTIFSAAIPPEGPSSPRPVLSLVIALLASLILATVAIFAIEFLNPRLLSEEEVVARGPILASVPWAPRELVRGYLHGGEGLPSEFWEAYRTLRASLVGDTGSGRPGRSIVITSAIQGEGKTMTAVNLAAAFTAGGFKVILVDGDLRRPMVADAFGLSGGESGLAALLEGEAAPAEVLLDAPGFDDRFRLLLPGPERPVDLLEPVRVEVLLDELKGEADVVVVDSSPLTEFADTFAFAEAADVVLVVVRLGFSRRDKLAELNRFLAQHRIIPSGFVVTGARRFHPSIGRRRRAGQAVPEKETAETQRIRPVPDSVER
jgi:Mrp family chromosome partitioning ATPase